MFADIETPVERVAYQHNAAQSEDYPNQQGVVRHMGVQTDPHAASPGLGVLQHFGGQTGLHGFTGRVRARVDLARTSDGAATKPVECGLAVPGLLMPTKRAEAVQRLAEGATQAELAVILWRGSGSLSLTA